MVGCIRFSNKKGNSPHSVSCLIRMQSKNRQKQTVYTSFHFYSNTSTPCSSKVFRHHATCGDVSQTISLKGGVFLGTPDEAVQNDSVELDGVWGFAFDLGGEYVALYPPRKR